MINGSSEGQNTSFIYDYKGAWKSYKKFQKESLYKLFNFFSDLENNREGPEMKSTTQKVVEVILNSIITLQIIGLNWHLQSDYEFLKPYEIYWQLFGYASFDNICADSNWLIQCYYGFLLMIAMTALLVFLALLWCSKTRKLSTVPRFFLKKCIGFLATIGLVPISTLLLLVIKYSSKDSNEIKEYTDCENCNLNLGSLQILASIVGLFFLLCLSIFNELFTAELRHSQRSDNIKSKAHSGLNIEMLWITYLSVGFFVVLNEYSNAYVKFILIFFPSRVILNAFFNRPYYNFEANWILIARNATILLTTLAFVFGKSIDDSGVILLLFFIVDPLIIIILLHIYKKTENFVARRYSIPKSQYEFEIKFRNELSTAPKEIGNIVLKFSKVDKIPHFYKDKLLVIWETNYCLYVLNDERLARVKLTKAKHTRSSIEGDFQEWLLYKCFEDSNTALYEDINLLSYLLELEKVKKDDRILCYYLIGFWDEITSRNPRVDKLHFIMKNLSSKLIKVKKKYSGIIAKFPSSAYSHELYGTLLQDMLGDYETGGKMLMKKDNLMALENQQPEDKFFQFSEFNGFLLISANRKNFGVITFANPKASLILKQSTVNLIGTKIVNYIPSPYDQHHDFYMQKFIENCTNPDISMTMGFFLQTERGYLVECKFQTRLVALESNLYFMTSLKQIHKSRQIALLSADGYILSHSELFTHYIDETINSFKGIRISELIPEIDISIMDSFDPLTVKVKGHPIVFSHIIHKTGSTVMHALLLIHERNEMTQWQKREDYDQINFFQNNLSSQIISEPTLSPSLMEPRSWQEDKIAKHLSISNISYESMAVYDKENETKTLGQKELEKTSQTQSSYSASQSSKKYIGFGNNMVIKSESTLRLFKWTLLASILIVIAANIIIMALIYNQITYSNNLGVIKRIAEILYESSKVAYLTRAMDTGYKFKIVNYTYYKEMFFDTFDDIEIIQDQLINDYQRWSKCKVSSKIADEDIPNWSPERDPEYLNLYDSISRFIESGKKYVTAIESNQSYSFYESELILNTYGNFYQTLNSSFIGFVDCEINTLKEANTIIDALTFLGVIIVGICFMGLIPITKKFVKTYDALLNFVKSLAQTSYFEVHQNILNRLSAIHDIAQEFELNNRFKVENIKIHYKNGYRMIVLCAIFVAISSLYYFLISYWLYPFLQDYVIKRYDFMQCWYTRSAYISEISLWSREVTTKSFYPLSGILTPHYAFRDPNFEIISKINSFDQTNIDISGKKYSEMYSNKLKKYIFESQANPDDLFFSYGSYPGATVLVIESYYNSFGGGTQTDRAIYYNRMSILQKGIKNVTDQADIDSSELIMNELNSMTYITIGYCFFCVGLYFFLYIPYIYLEKQKLYRLQTISALMPSHIIQRNEDSTQNVSLFSSNKN